MHDLTCALSGHPNRQILDGCGFDLIANFIKLPMLGAMGACLLGGTFPISVPLILFTYWKNSIGNQKEIKPKEEFDIINPHDKD